jgi:type I restriction enzyme S subunit
MADEVETLDLIGDLPPSWKVARFGDVLEGGTRNGIYKAKDFHGRGAKIVNMGELFAHPRLRDVPMKRVELSDSEMEKSCLKKDDLLFARRSLVAEGAGKCIVVAEVKEPTTFESSIIRARPNPQVVDSLFLYYLFNSPYGAYVLQTIRRQVAVSGVTGTDLVELPVPLPPLAEQKAIAAVLGALDDKIELNRRMNATLEAMARALFQSWFVDFEPVRAKLDGRQPVGLDPATAALFPESFDGSAVGQIPNGWSIKPVGEVVDCVGGGTPSTAEPIYWEGGTHHWTTPKDFSSLQAPVLLDTDRKLTDAGIAKISSGLLPAGTLLLSSRAPVGYLAITAMPVAINQGFIALKCNGFASNIFMLNWCQTNIAEIESRATGTTFAEISKQNFRPIPVVLPPIELMAAFTAKAAPLYAQISANLHQSQALANLRDTLLPKLLSGELNVEGH